MFNLAEYIKTFLEIDNTKIKEEWKEVFEQMAVHTRKKKPENLLLAMRPNEEEKIFKYRLKNYRAITYGSMNRALDSTSRILNKANYTVEVEDKTKEYLKTKNFYGLDFYKFLDKIVFKRDIEDPNGFLVWLPTGEGLKDSAIKIEPKPKLFYSYDLWDANENVISFLSEEKSVVSTGSASVKEGNVYYLFTKNEFYKLVQIGVKSENKYRLDLIYKHNIGEIPVIILGGDMNAMGYYESYFAPYCAFGDQAISQFSDWQATMVTSGFPYREEFYTSCEVRRINKKSNPVSPSEEKYEADIEWRPLNKSPYGTIIREIPGGNQDNLLGDKVLPADVPSIRFIAPPVEVAKYSGESWENLLDKAEDALHLNLANGTNQSGIAKEKDLEQQTAMIDKIASNFFGNIMLNSLKFIEAYLFVKPFSEISSAINTPSSFRTPTVSEMVDELGLLKEKKAPSLFLSQATVELAKRRFSGNPVSQKIFEAISIIDPLYIYDTEQKSSMVLNGVITKDAFIRSIYIYSLLLKISYDKTEKDFTNLPIDKIKELFDKEVEPYLNQEVQQLTNPDGTPV